MAAAGGDVAGTAVAPRPGRAEVEAVVACLPTLGSREECDEVAINFCYVNSKGARKRMVRTQLLTSLKLNCSLVLYAARRSRWQHCKKA